MATGRTAEEWVGKTIFYVRDGEDEEPDDWETNEIVQAFVAATAQQFQPMVEDIEEPASEDEVEEETACQLLHPV